MIDIPLKIIELENENFHILIEGVFDDGFITNWIIDTGASKTVFDINLKKYFVEIDKDNSNEYQSAGINQGMMETMVGEMKIIRFGDLEILNHKVALIDLQHVNDIYSKYSQYKIAGLIGGDILMNYKCVINYDQKNIVFNF